jgi:putative redox protein
VADGHMQASVRWAGDGMFIGFSPGGHAVPIETRRERGSAASPVELLLLSLGGCTGVDVVNILEKKRIKVTAYEARLSAERSPESPKKFTKIHVHHVVRGTGLTAHAVEQAIELSEKKYCSVAASLQPTVEITSSYELVDDTQAAVGY